MFPYFLQLIIEVPSKIHLVLDSIVIFKLPFYATTFFVAEALQGIEIIPHKAFIYTYNYMAEIILDHSLAAHNHLDMELGLNENLNVALLHWLPLILHYSAKYHTIPRFQSAHSPTFKIGLKVAIFDGSTATVHFLTSSE